MTTTDKPASRTNPLGPGYDVAGQEMRYRDAFNKTLRDEMNRDPDVFVMGEDISGGFDNASLLGCGCGAGGCACDVVGAIIRAGNNALILYWSWKKRGARCQRVETVEANLVFYQRR